MGLFQNLTGWHALIILAVIILLFGATKLPALAKSVGQSMNIFKTEMRDAAAHTPAAAEPSGPYESPTPTTAFAAPAATAPASAASAAAAATAAAPERR
jgi:sec-independent protein translocase protein TatA